MWAGAMITVPRLEPKTSSSETCQDTSLLKRRTPCLNKEDCGDSAEDKATKGGGTWFLEWLHAKPLLCCEHCTWARSIKIFQVTENLVYLLQQIELAFHKALWDSALWESKNMRENLSICLTPLNHKKGLENTHTYKWHGCEGYWKGDKFSGKRAK